MAAVRWVLGCLLVLAAAAPAAGQAPPDDPNKPIQDILTGIRQRADEQKHADQRRALLLLQQAQTARKAGRLSEAVTLIRKAQELFPESEEIKQAHRRLLAEQRSQREAAINLAVAQERLSEALRHAEALARAGRRAEARELTEAVLIATGRFPAGVDLTEARQSAEKVFAEVTDAPADVQPLPVAPREADLSLPALKQALARPMTVDWRNESLVTILQEVSRHTGVKVVIDPALERVRGPLARRLDLRLTRVSAERVLQLATEQTGTDYVLVEGQVVITTKDKAVQFTVARNQGLPEAGSLHRLLHPELYRLTPPRDLPVLPPAPPPLLDIRPPPPKVPDYLQSGRAFLDHIDELLKGVPAPATKP